LSKLRNFIVFPSKPKQMSEQMFNIAAQFSAKLTLSLSFLTARLFLIALLLRDAPPLGMLLFLSLCFSVSLFLCVTLFSFAFRGGCSHIPRRAMPIVPQQRHAPSLSPRLRHYGGCSRVCRRFLWRKSRNSVARLVLAAVHFGDNCANFAIERQSYAEAETHHLNRFKIAHVTSFAVLEVKTGQEYE
jgi:hypothetical protein